jgi:uncharacterized circularly permuted ATP-grasp superfamily protein
VGDLFDGYDCGQAWDEMFESPGVPRTHYEALYALLGTLSSGEYQARCSARDRGFRDQGITFSLSGEERPFPLDLVPRIITGAEWELIDAGVSQRVRALEAFLADVYGTAEVLHDRVLPRRLIATSRHFVRPATGITPPNGVRIHVAGVDLVRDATGRLRVLEDNLRTPSGISYVIENRRAMTHVFPELFASNRVRPVATYPARLLEALRAAAPGRRSDPTVVVLTPGVHNAAYFEHSFLARQMGVELVEGRDLLCHDGVVSTRTTAGHAPVDVIYRRVDDDYLDPLQFRPDSAIGCPGLLNAARLGNVTIANAVGNGVADDKAVYPYVPKLIEYYLGERPILDNVPTFDLGDHDQRADVLARLDRVVVKPVDASGGHGLVVGPHATDEELAEVSAAIRADPRGWIAQEVVMLSTSPTYDDRGFAARHVDLRPFAVHDGRDVWVSPGALTRVALRHGSMVVNSSQGGGSKDTWILGGGIAERGRAVVTSQEHRPRVLAPPIVGGPGLEAGQQ